MRVYYDKPNECPLHSPEVAMSSAFPAWAMTASPTSNSNMLEELVRRAETLQPLLTANAAVSEASRRAAEENITAAKEAGLFRLMVPKRYGGYEGTLRAHL